jgi:hypothetical protein
VLISKILIFAGLLIMAVCLAVGLTLPSQLRKALVWGAAGAFVYMMGIFSAWGGM